MGCGASTNNETVHVASMQQNKRPAGYGNFQKPSRKKREEDPNVLGVLVVSIVEARNLPANDAFSTASDPFVTMSFSGKTFKTKVKRSTSAPVWKQKCVVLVHKNQLDFNLAFNVWDQDLISKNDILATLNVEISTYFNDANNNASRRDQWYPLKPRDHLTSESGGELHLIIDVSTREALEKRFWSEMIKAVDTDGDNKLSHIEFRSLLENLGSSITDSQLDEMFDSANTNHDDHLDLDELHVLVSLPNVKHSFQFKNCPFCNHELDPEDDEILLHFGGCIDNDGEEILNAGFLTDNQASQGWISKMAEYISLGDIKIGVNNGNILVFDRRTGQLEEEKIPPFVRMPIRLLYQQSHVASSAEVSKLLSYLTKQQGQKFTSPKSKKEIPEFIKFHSLNVDEILDPLDSFQNFNEFFYRKLKADARKISDSDLVSPADCRCVLFPHISSATEIWIKGKKFTIASMIQDEQLAKKYKDGSLAIFRLAPQDYHRFHIPIDGVIKSTKLINGGYKTVNPMAVRGAVDVFTENKRAITVIDSYKLGQVIFVTVGATCVGSINFTSEEGKEVKRGDEHGYFAFGGSTVILLFEPNMIIFDMDIVENSRKPIETLLKVGESVGRATGRGAARLFDSVNLDKSDEVTK